MLNVELENKAGNYTTFNQSTAQVAGFYDGYFAVVLTGGTRPKYSDTSKRVRFTSVLVACDENGVIADDFAQVLELGSNLSKIIYKGNLMSAKSTNDYVNKWLFDKQTFGAGTPVFSFGMIVKVSSYQQYGFVKPFKFDVDKELTKDPDGNYKIREDLKALHSVFTFANTGKFAAWSQKGKAALTTFSDEKVKQRVEKHIRAYFKQQQDFANQQQTPEN